jgi:hypothetical protein
MMNTVPLPAVPGYASDAIVRSRSAGSTATALFSAFQKLARKEHTLTSRVRNRTRVSAVDSAEFWPNGRTVVVRLSTIGIRGHFAIVAVLYYIPG